MTTPHHPSTIDTAALREIASLFRFPKSPVEGLILFAAEAELQRRQDEVPRPFHSAHIATAQEMHP